MDSSYLFYILAGYLSGSILFAKLFPLLWRGIDVQKESADGNPGTFNAFVHAGPLCGSLVLIAELAKGAVPVALCARTLGTGSGLFALVMAAPVLGHARSIFQKGQGGKGIAVSFGVLIGLLPFWRPLAILIVCYLLFLLIFPNQSNARKSIYAFLAFGAASVLLLPHRAIMSGCVLMAVIVLHKHYVNALDAVKSGGEWRLE